MGIFCLLNNHHTYVSNGDPLTMQTSQEITRCRAWSNLTERRKEEATHDDSSSKQPYAKPSNTGPMKEKKPTADCTFLPRIRNISLKNRKYRNTT